MSCLKRCWTKKTVEQRQIESERRIYNEQHFSSGTELPVHRHPIVPSTVLDKKLVVGQFGEPQRTMKILSHLEEVAPSN